ncbi:MAG: hypothetical protein L0211_18045 [Planctomycetaceae bacterium]|nr:hypothetical protein [Planctomycetaceae bacterium]
MSEMLGPRETAALGILAYRRVIEPIPGMASPADNVSPARLKEQLEGLLGRGFQVWPLSQVAGHLREGRPIPRRVFAITFHDPFENVYLNAFPILRLLELPATVFLAPACLDVHEPLPHERWEPVGLGNIPYTTWKPLTTVECKEMHRSGLVELGLRANLGEGAGRSAAGLAAEFEQGLRHLSEQFGIKQASIVFPRDRAGEGGAQEFAAAAQAAGARCGLTNEPRLVRPGDSPFALGGFSAEEDDTAASLAAKLSGWYEAVHSLGRTMLWRGPSPPRPGANAETERN